MRHAWNEMFADLDRKSEEKGYGRNLTNFGKVVAGAVFVVLTPFGVVADLVLRGVALARPE
jgi:hypothetical protein